MSEQKQPQLVELIRKDEWPSFKLRAIREEAKKMMGREFPLIDGKTGQELMWEKEIKYTHKSYGLNFVVAGDSE